MLSNEEFSSSSLLIKEDFLRSAVLDTRVDSLFKVDWVEQMLAKLVLFPLGLRICYWYGFDIEWNESNCSIWWSFKVQDLQNTQICFGKSIIKLITISWHCYHVEKQIFPPLPQQLLPKTSKTNSYTSIKKRPTHPCSSKRTLFGFKFQKQQQPIELTHSYFTTWHAYAAMFIYFLSQTLTQQGGYFDMIFLTLTNIWCGRSFYFTSGKAIMIKM